MGNTLASAFHNGKTDRRRRIKTTLPARRPERLLPTPTGPGPHPPPPPPGFARQDGPAIRTTSGVQERRTTAAHDFGIHHITIQLEYTADGCTEHHHVDHLYAHSADERIF